MTLHVFNDSHGFTLNLTVSRFASNNKLADNIFVNLTDKTIFKNGRVIYLGKKLSVYRKFIKGIKNVERVCVYPLDGITAVFLQIVEEKFPDIECDWIFWSYEYYQRPAYYPKLFGTFSGSYVNSLRVSRIKAAAANFVKKLLGVPVGSESTLESYYSRIRKFYSFLPQDHRNIYDNRTGPKPIYHQFSFLTTEEISKDVVPQPMQKLILVGHAASPTGNHAEILERLAANKIEHQLLIPAEYGDKKYGAAIKQLAEFLFPGKVNWIGERLELKDYHQKLSAAGWAVYNFYTQEALGNILFMTWNGSKIFLNEESSVYQQFRNWGLKVFTVNNDLNNDQLSSFLPPADADHNRKILEDLFNEQQVNKYWRSLMESPPASHSRKLN
jgi:dTDP-N-acetylfucosamine:lipid II N-acetylfucosaminyltransferase